MYIGAMIFGISPAEVDRMLGENPVYYRTPQNSIERRAFETLGINNAFDMLTPLMDKHRVKYSNTAGMLSSYRGRSVSWNGYVYAHQVGTYNKPELGEFNKLFDIQREHNKIIGDYMKEHYNLILSHARLLPRVIRNVSIACLERVKYGRCKGIPRDLIDIVLSYYKRPKNKTKQRYYDEMQLDVISFNAETA